MKSNTKKFWSVFKSVSRTSSVPRKMVWSRDDRSVTAEQLEDIANLLNDCCHSTFKSPLSRAEYADHPSTKTMTTLNNTLSDIVITPDEVKNILSLDDNKATGPENIPVC